MLKRVCAVTTGTRGEAHWFERVWRYSFNIPCCVHFHPVKRPVTKIWEDQFYELMPWANALLVFVQFGFAAVHFAAWNFHFPSYLYDLSMGAAEPEVKKHFSTHISLIPNRRTASNAATDSRWPSAMFLVRVQPQSQLPSTQHALRIQAPANISTAAAAGPADLHGEGDSS